MPSLRLSACFVGFALSATAICTMADAAVIKVACIGEQSTHSHHLEYPQEYPAHLQTLLGTGYEVMNFGDGVGMLTTGHPPGDYSEYVKSVGYMQSLTYDPRRGAGCTPVPFGDPRERQAGAKAKVLGAAYLSRAGAG